jgi:hypothetical protein
MLVEANQATLYSLDIAENNAVRVGANAVSNSWGAGEFGREVFAQHNFHHPGVMITASAGDSGYGTQFPAA